MTNDNPFFMNFNVNDFMNQFAVPGVDSEQTKKLMSIHQKNLDAFVAANKAVTDGYKNIANKQMEIFQDGMTKMASYTPEEAAERSQSTFTESAQQMKELIELASRAHQEAFDILSSRTKDLMTEVQE